MDRHEELEAIDRVIVDLYRSICFEKGETPPLELLRQVFMPGAKMINNDADDPAIRTPEDYIEGFMGFMEELQFESFHEIEIAHRTDLFGKIAQRFSTYETRLSLDDAEPLNTGINSIQLIKTNGEWRITCMVWNNQTPKRPIPEQYL